LHSHLLYYEFNPELNFLFSVSVCVHPIRRLVAYSFLISIYFFNYSPTYAHSRFETLRLLISPRTTALVLRFVSLTNKFTWSVGLCIIVKDHPNVLNCTNGIISSTVVVGVQVNYVIVSCCNKKINISK